MSLLKRFGATASNSPTKTKKNGRLRLRTTLFLQPFTILLFSFGLIFLLFNGAMHYVINSQADKAIESQFHQLDRLFMGESSVQNTTRTIFSSTYVIVDQEFKVQYVSAALGDEEEAYFSEEIARYAHQKDEEKRLSDMDNIGKVTLDDTTYMVKMATYTGKLEKYYIKKNSGKRAQTYRVFVFVDVSPASYLSWWLNSSLLLLMVIIGFIASLFIYLTGKRVDSAFTSLKDSITRLGKRQKLGKKEELPYEEFNDVMMTVAKMSDMIDANQRSQQLFFQNASHELRTPLMSIQGYAEGLKEGVLKNSKEAAGIIYDESQKMTELVDDILTLSKLETIQTKINLERVVLDNLLYDVSWRLKHKADERGLVFEHDFHDDNCELVLDETLMERAFLNIISNAVRYAKHTITLSTELLEDKVVVHIANDGPEISKETQEHIFERFYKGEKGQFGIGLSMTKDIIERQGGQISLRSQADKTTFSVALPLVAD